MPRKSRCKKLPLDKKQIAKVPNMPAVDKTASVSCQPIQVSSSRLQVGSPGPAQTAAARFRMAKQLLGQACTIL
eukprot:487828-Pelagomonas_calceolata.AAC.2